METLPYLLNVVFYTLYIIDVSIDKQEMCGVSSIRSRFDHLSCDTDFKDLSQCSINSKENSKSNKECLLYSQGSMCDIEVGLTCIGR